MADAETADAQRAPCWTSAVARGFGLLVVSFVALCCVAAAAEARVAIRRHTPYDNFFFHGNYVAQPFDPSDGFSLELWNCANGEKPTFIADVEPLIACGYDAATGYILGDLVYAADVPAGTCVDHGRSCYYRDTAASADNPGVRYFRVQYARPGRGNRIWLDSYGNLSAATQANMLLLIEIDGHTRAVRVDTYIPLVNGGWFIP